MKRLVWAATAVLVFGLCALVPVRASAQQDDLANGWEISAGFFVPQEAAARSAGDNIWLALGASRRFWNLEHTSAALSIDYYGTNKMHAVPILANVSHEMKKLRVGAGIGIGMLHGITRSTTAFAYKLSVGYDLRQNELQHPVYVDLSYRGTTQVSQQLNGFEVSLSYTF